MLLWQDVYVWEGLGGAGGVSSSQVDEQTYSYKGCTQLYTPLFVIGLLTHRISFQGSREGSESGEGILADEIDKLQVVTIGFSNIV